MADLGCAIVGLVSASVSLADRIYGYVSSCKHASEAAQDVAAQVSSVGKVLCMLRTHLERENSLGNSFDRTSVLFFAVDGCNQQLEKIHKRIAPYISGSRGSQLIQSIKWPLDKDDISEAVGALRGYTQIFHFAVNLDGMSYRRTIISANQTVALAQIQHKLDALGNGETDSVSIQTQLKAILASIRNLRDSTADELKQIQQQFYQLQLDARISTLLSSLQSLPFQEIHRDLQMHRVDGLGQWLLNMPKYQAWCEGSLEKAVLWCYGAPGVGKTYLTSVVVDQLQGRSLQTGCRVLYFYFDYKQQPDQTPFKVLITLLRQLLSTYATMPNAASELYKRIERGQGLPSWKELMIIFRDICSKSSEVFLILDALDECDENTNREPILELIEFLIDSRARVLVTSRPYPWDIKETFADYPQIQIEAADSDIRAFLCEKISNSKRSSRCFIDETLSEEIVQSITRKSHGMFLLPALQIDNILGQTNKRQVRDALRSLPVGLIEHLDQTMARIKSQDSQGQPRAELAINTLMWLSNVKRSLTIDELRHAIAIIPGSAELDDLTDPNIFAECCVGLVAIDSKSSTVRLVHLSINEYLQERCAAIFPHADGKLAVRCLSYLSLDDFRGAPPPTKGHFDMLSFKFPFLDYATAFWGVHAALCFDAEVEAKTLRFLSNKTLVEFWSQRFEYTKDKRMSDRDDQQITKYIINHISALHVAARFGIEILAQDALNGGNSDPNMRDSLGRTSLMLAASSGQKHILHLLMSRGSTDVNLTDFEGNTALGYAVKHTQFESVQILLSSSVMDVNTGRPILDVGGDYFEWHLLPSPSRYGIAALLLSRPELDLNVVDSRGHPAWFLVARTGDVNTVKLFLARKDFDPSPLPALRARLDDLCSHILNTYYTDEEEIVNVAARLLLTLDQDPRFHFSGFQFLQGLWPILYYAFADDPPYKNLGNEYRYNIDGFNIVDVSCGKLRFNVRASLESHGFSLDMRDSQGRTFLHFVAQYGKAQYVEFLIQRGADINDKDGFGWTPLHYAVDKGDEAISYSLLKEGAIPTTADNDSWTVLHHAAARGHKQLVKLLLSNGADVNARDVLGMSILRLAGGSTNAESIISMLLDSGAEIDATDDFGRTFLHDLVWRRRADIYKLLLRKGANPNICSVSGTILHYATQTMDDEAARTIMDAGGDLYTLDCYGRSSWDWIASFEPFQEKLGLSRISYRPTQSHVTRCHLLKCVRERIRLMLSIDAKLWGSLAFRLAKQLLFLGDDASALVVFEAHITTDRNSKTLEFNFSCGNCYTNVGPLHPCKSCAIAAFCSRCVHERPVDKVPWCRGHSFLKVPGEGWRDLPKGCVNEKGQSFEDWLKDLQKRYCSPAMDGLAE